MKLRYISARKAIDLINNRLTYMFNRKSGKAGRMPLSLSVEPAAVCQLHCPECIYGRNELRRTKRFLDINLYKKVIDEASPHLNCLILYFQGEPFLAPDIFEMIEYADKHNIFTQTSSNAQAIDEICARRIVESGLQKLIISLDGITQENYAKYRIGGDIEKTFKALEYINKYKKELHSSAPSIELQMIVFGHNEHEIGDFRLIAKKYNASAVLKTAQIYDLNSEDKSALLPKNQKYSRYACRNGEWVLKKPIRNRCIRMWQGAVVSSDGELLPCCFDKNGEFSYGNLNTACLKELWNSGKAVAFRKQVLNNRKSMEICRNCSE